MEDALLAKESVTQDAERRERERLFHDLRYTSDPRKRISFFYRLARCVKNQYYDLLTRDCAGKRVLDVGCGRGDSSLLMASRGAQVSGIDVSRVVIEEVAKRMREKKLQVDFRIMDAENMDYGDCYFDVVCGTGVLHHLDLEMSLGEIKRVLKVGGVGIFLEPLGHNPLINLFRFLTPSLRTPDEHPMREKDLRLIHKIFPRSRFSYYHLTTFFSLPLVRLPSKLFEKVIALLTAVDRFLFDNISSLRKYSWIVLLVLEKEEEDNSIYHRGSLF